MCRIVCEKYMAPMRKLIGTTVLFSLLFVSCSKETPTFTSEERKTIDSIVHKVHSIDSLALLQKGFEQKGDKLGSIVALREWGKKLRSESRFDEALHIHSKGLRQAEAVNDTLEWIPALNNIGTNYRRLGVWEVAEEYHYRAWKMSEEFSDTSTVNKKHRVVSLNGLGNIYLTIGNYRRADSILRLALAGEEELGSHLGQAINYANLGSVLEHRGQTDSAWVYYRKSMELNEKANNNLGKALCHIYFGSLHEKAKEYEKATAEYQTAYALMKNLKDDWHALNSLIALAGINYATNDDGKVLYYLKEAKALAEQIKSPEHLAEIYTLYYKFHKRRGDYRQALACHEEATAFQAGVIDMEKVNRFQNTSLSIERGWQTEQMNRARQKLEQEQMLRYVSYWVFALVLVFMLLLISLMYYIQRIRSQNYRVLKRLSNVRETFFTNITHEFRTPLTLILGLSHEMAKDEKNSVTVQEKAEVIERQGGNLLALINQLLDISKIQSAIGDPDWRSGNIVAYIDMIVESYRDYAQSKGINLQFFSKEEIEMDFVPDYVNKVINNLLSNSFKFTPEYGKISVTVWREENNLLLDVADTGIGIPQDCLEHLFEPFYRAGNSCQIIGSGVGLALVKQIIDVIGGTITVESVMGKGTTFHVCVPVRHGEKKYAAVKLEESKNTPLLLEEKSTQRDDTLADNENGNKRRILIIEDNGDVAKYIGAQLTNDYDIAFAINGNEGLEKAIETVPDLIITDLMMPGMDGIEVCRRVRSNDVTNHIPIVILTAKITEADRIKGLEAGADAYLTKPFSCDELRIWIERLLEQRRQLREKYMQTIESEAEEDELNEADKRFLTKLADHIYILVEGNQNIEVSAIASHMCMSYSQFNRKMTALTGYTPLGYIQRVKIKKAQKMLQTNPELSFREVSEQCGFSDYSNFVRSFKNVCGMTPKQFVKGETL